MKDNNDAQLIALVRATFRRTPEGGIERIATPDPKRPGRPRSEDAGNPRKGRSYRLKGGGTLRGHVIAFILDHGYRPQCVIAKDGNRLNVHPDNLMEGRKGRPRKPLPPYVEYDDSVPRQPFRAAPEPGKLLGRFKRPEAAHREAVRIRDVWGL
jgi:hypothetical protein